MAHLSSAGWGKSSWQCLHLSPTQTSQPIQRNQRRAALRQHRQRFLREILFPLIYLSVVLGGLLYFFSQAAAYDFFPFPQRAAGVSHQPDSISCLSHPLQSGRLPDGAPLGHICSLFGKQRLNSSAELTACSPRQFASCSVANASLAFQGNVISAALKG